ncbi:MAG: TIGR02449 family protein [Xanthomonadaceae bacterium]|nr:TIGR02449 family protein [Xanthomonadaceae bacterium]
MASDAPRETQAELDLKKLDFRIDELIRAVERLKEENRSLQQKQDVLVSERAALVQKNELVRTRVEAMISRLRSLEHG